MWYNIPVDGDTAIMTYKGHVQNGNVILDDPVQLEEGTAVEVLILRSTAQGTDMSSTTFAEYFAEVIGAAEGLPPDLSEHHDRYLRDRFKS